VVGGFGRWEKTNQGDKMNKLMEYGMWILLAIAGVLLIIGIIKTFF